MNIQIICLQTILLPSLQWNAIIKKDNHSKQADAFCFTFIPLNVIDTFKVNTQNEDDMKTFVEQTIYSNAYQSDLKCLLPKRRPTSN